MELDGPATVPACTREDKRGRAEKNCIVFTTGMPYSETFFLCMKAAVD
jgi:hypothetical protein